MYSQIEFRDGHKVIIKIESDCSYTPFTNDENPISRLKFFKNHPKVEREDFLKELQSLSDEDFYNLTYEIKTKSSIWGILSK